MIFVRCVLLTLNPPSHAVLQEPRSWRSAIVDSGEGDAARGDWTGTMDGIVRPMLPWTNEVLEDRPETKSRVG